MEKDFLTAPGGRGVRFAPSPTGRFHLGNLRTAWISWEWAQALGEPWVVRFEDIDAPRVVPQAKDTQLADMGTLGLKPDLILIQSDFRHRHWETFQKAVRQKRVYPCYCSRKDVREALESAASAPHPGVSRTLTPPYSGRCRHLPAALSASDLGLQGLPTLAWRFAVEGDSSGRSDFIVGRTSSRLDEGGMPAEPLSFVPAYHWACAVDDLDGGYRLLVRAADLAEVVEQHRGIMEWLARSEGKAGYYPAVFHTALVTQNDGHRLEKRTRGVTLPELLDAGWSAQRILGRFRSGFSLEARDWAPGKVFGEPRSSLTLSDLGF